MRILGLLMALVVISASSVIASDTPVDNSNTTVVPTTTTCSICSDGSAITLPDKKVQIPGFEFVDDCQAISTLAKALLPAESEECALLHSIGTLCGCPKSPDSCELCGAIAGGSVRYAQRELGFLAPSFNGVVPTCEMVEAGLHSYPKDDTFCIVSQTYFSEYCGCGATDNVPPVNEQPCSLCGDRGEHHILRNRTIEITNFPFETCGQFADAVATLFSGPENAVFDEILEYGTDNCTLARTFAMYCGCPNPFYIAPENQCKLCGVDDTYTSPLPDNFAQVELLKGLGFGDSLMPSCRALTDYAKSFSSTNTYVGHPLLCSAIQAIGAESCGCTPKEAPPCPICTDNIPDEFLDKTVGTVWPFDSVTCGTVSQWFSYLDFEAIIPFGSKPNNWRELSCDVYQYSGFICGCNNGVFSYWGSDTLSQQQAAAWLQRVSAILSFFGSVAIIIDIFRRRNATKVKSQIMLGLSFFDIISSVGWGIGPMATDKGFFELYLGFDPAWLGREDSTFYGSIGTETSCLAQGFVLHWGFTSVLFNVCLAYFYKLLIVNNMRENNFTTRLRLVMLCTPIVIGTTVAILSMQFIISTPIGCTFGSFSTDGGWAKVVFLFYLPYGPAFVYIPFTTYSIYNKVRTQTGSVNRNINRAISNRSSTGASSEGQSSNASPEPEGRWRWMWFLSMRSGQDGPSLESKVFWESFWYVVAFFASYTIFLFVFAIDGLQEDAYGVLVLASILTPLQGFFNSLNYFRPTLGKMCRQGFQKLANSRERIFRFLPSIANRNSIPSAMIAMQGDYGLSELPSNMSELRSSRIKSSRMFRSDNIPRSDIQRVPPAIDEEEYESEPQASTVVSSNPQVSSAGKSSGISEISPIAASALESETSEIAQS